MAFNPQNSNGQKTTANSAPVVLASDQSTVPVSVTNIGPSAGIGDVRLTDQTNTVSVKAASTAAVATDKALVVAVSPSNFPTSTTLSDNHAIPTTTEVGAIGEVVNGIGNLEKARAVTASYNASSVGIPAAGMVAQLDDTSPTTVTEDNFGVVRMSSRRALLVEGVSGGTALPVNGSTTTTTSLTAGSLNADLVPSTDVSAYRTAYLQVDGTWVGTLTFQHSNDNTTFYSHDVDVLKVSNSVLSGTATTNDIYVIPVYAKYLRVRMTSYTSGTATGTIYLSSMPSQMNKASIYNGNLILSAGANLIGKVGLDQTTPGTTNAVALSTLGTGAINTSNGTASTGTLRVAIASDNTANSNPWLVRHAASTTSSGLLLAKINSAATTNATVIKASAGTIYGWSLTNTTAVNQVVHIYTTVTVAPTVGTTTPAYNIVLPPNGGMVMPFGIMNIPAATGITYSITTGLTDLDATATTANSVVGTIYYI